MLHLRVAFKGTKIACYPEAMPEGKYATEVSFKSDPKKKDDTENVVPVRR